jgi:hypothetical protein
MNRAALAAVLLAVGGSACAPPPPPPTLTLYWQFVGSQGQVYGNGTQRDPGCVAANVDQVRMFVTGPGGWVLDDFVYPCVFGGVPGIFYDGLVPGAYSWAMEGRRLGMTVFYQEGVTNVFEPVVRTVPLLADFPDLLVSYTLPAGVTCASNWTGFPLGQIAFQILSTVPPFVEEYGDPNLFLTCQDPPNAFTVPSLPPGTYHMSFIAALTPTVIPPASAYQECAVPFTHGNVVDEVPFFLARTVGSCR